jgi:hypothetical protein
MLDGLPAHVMVIAGLALALMVPLIQGSRAAGLAGSAAEVDQAERLIELRMDEFKQKTRQEQESRQDESRRRSDLESSKRNLETQRATLEQDLVMPLDEKERRLGEVRSRLADVDRQLAAMPGGDGARGQSDTESAERKKWEERYNLTGRKEAFLDARVSAVGGSLHLLLGWLGRLMLIVGLLVMTVQSAGLRQKILLIVLLVVLFSALSGVNLGFRAQGNLGESPREETTPPPPSNR